ncbi:MAG: hypothetical protein PVS3B3_20920 [Ktedonobacteraceae bacterium]
MRNTFALAIQRKADRLNRLVEDLLDMSRIEGVCSTQRMYGNPPTDAHQGLPYYTLLRAPRIGLL